MIVSPGSSTPRTGRRVAPHRAPAPRRSTARPRVASPVTASASSAREGRPATIRAGKRAARTSWPGRAVGARGAGGEGTTPSGATAVVVPRRVELDPDAYVDRNAHRPVRDRDRDRVPVPQPLGAEVDKAESRPLLERDDSGDLGRRTGVRHEEQGRGRTRGARRDDEDREATSRVRRTAAPGTPCRSGHGATPCRSRPGPAGALAPLQGAPTTRRSHPPAGSRRRRSGAPARTTGASPAWRAGR